MRLGAKLIPLERRLADRRWSLAFDEYICGTSPAVAGALRVIDGGRTDH
jgi:hypothetical protein